MVSGILLLVILYQWTTTQSETIQMKAVLKYVM